MVGMGNGGIRPDRWVWNINGFETVDFHRCPQILFGMALEIRLNDRLCSAHSSCRAGTIRLGTAESSREAAKARRKGRKSGDRWDTFECGVGTARNSSGSSVHICDPLRLTTVEVVIGGRSNHRFSQMFAEDPG